MLSQKAQDAAFFDMVHELVLKNKLMQTPAAAQKSGDDRRRERRVAFPYIQLLAPFDGVELPPQSDFRHVHCHDLSTRGFSYFETQLPTYRHVVMLFGRLPFRVFTADVKHIRKSTKAGVYLIGCRIVSRLTK